MGIGWCRHDDGFDAIVREQFLGRTVVRTSSELVGKLLGFFGVTTTYGDQIQHIGMDQTGREGVCGDGATADDTESHGGIPLSGSIC